ncbi:MAG: beta-propeller fold lactonase family protein, partial [Bryobacteraceae bacterium]|nr:beta-propeller fold lactonase family protein [Bryobacteraceae bacterium]
MRVLKLLAAVLLLVAAAYSATFGTVVSVVGGAADIVLDEPRGRLYLVNTAQTRVEVYSIAQRRVLSTVRTDSLPLAAALSRDGRFLYVTCYDATSVNVINLETLAITTRISLPAKPEGIAVGGDGKALISTIGTGAGNTSNVLLIWDPGAINTASLAAVPLSPPPPQSPLLPAPSGRVFLTSRSQLVPTKDGRFIVGVNIPNNNSRAVFVYEVASGTVLRSRTVTNVSSVVSVSPDGTKFMVGLTLFETDSLQILAQQNLANSPYPFANGTNFNTQQNQGGSTFSPDGSILYSAFNIAPVNATRTNVSQLMINDPENLLIRSGLQVTENLAGKMVINGDGSNIFALSESGFVILPVSTVNQSPLAVPESTVSLLTADQCGVYNSSRSSTIDIRNAGSGRFTVSAQLLQTTPVGPGGLGGVGGPGGGQVGGGIVITLPNAPGGITIPTAPILPGGIPTTQNASIAATSPQVRTTPTPDGGRLDLSYTTAASARNPGTVAPTHTLVLASDQAINIPPAVRVFQNFRDSDSRGEIIPVEVGLSANEGLVDMVVDNTRQRLYIANSGMNRVEVYDIRRRQLQAPVKVGQLPRSLAVTPDGSTMYVANSGGESISVVDLDSLRVTGKVKFPPLPFNSGAAIVTPSVLAASQRGLMIIMNNGTLWKLVGNEAVPRPLSPVIGTN